MAIPITPLSRLPSRWVVLVLPLLPGLALVYEVVKVLRSAAPISIGDWVGPLWLAFVTVALGLGLHSVPTTDFDADYLYLVKKTGTEQIPLASFYKLKEGNRGYWYLHYYDEQGHQKKLTIQPLGSGDDSSIHSLIEAIWPHNPQLDVRYDWWFK